MGEYERGREYLAFETMVGPAERTDLSGMTKVGMELAAARDTLAEPAVINPELPCGWVLLEKCS